MTYEIIMQRARETNRRRDQVDRDAGMKAPADGAPIMLLQTAMLAIEAGIKANNWDCIAEAQAMLEKLEKRVVAR